MPRPFLTPGKDMVPIVQENGWAPGLVWTGAENLAPTRIRSPDRPARSQSLYRLCYPAHKPSVHASILSHMNFLNGHTVPACTSLKIPTPRQKTYVMMAWRSITIDIHQLVLSSSSLEVCIRDEWMNFLLLNHGTITDYKFLATAKVLTIQ